MTFNMTTSAACCIKPHYCTNVSKKTALTFHISCER